MLIDKCPDCKYFHPPEKDQHGGTCHKNPPTTFMVPMKVPPSVGNPQGSTGIGIQAYFPPVGPETGGCGGFVASKLH